MARYIDAEAFFETFGELNTEPYNNFPTADVVEVVRCKECDFFRGNAKEGGCQLNKLFVKAVKADDYCSRGERRTE